MQYLISVIDDKTRSATPTEMVDIDDFNTRLEVEGRWVFAGGLDSPNTATVIDNRSGSAVFTDGPFVESKEHVAGFWIIEAPDLESARKLAVEGSRCCYGKVDCAHYWAK